MAVFRKIKPFDYRDYKVIGELGSGLSGKVYLARRHTNGELVALKRLHTTADKLVRELFLNEQNLLRKAEHPHILRYIEGGASEHEGFLVTQFAEGVRLDDVLGQPLNAAAIVQITEQLAQGLDYLHTQHPDHPIIHCDVKPSNIIVGEDGTVVLLDLSSARTTLLAPSDDAILLSPRYCAPEQFLHQPTIYSDQYALAVIAYELLTGVALFPNEKKRTIRNQEDAEQETLAVGVKLPKAMPATSEVLKRAIAWPPEGRYSSCLGFAAQLEGALRGDGLLRGFEETALQTSIIDRASQHQRKKRQQILALAGMIIMAAISLLVAGRFPLTSTVAGFSQTPAASATTTPTSTAAPVATGRPLANTLPTATLVSLVVPVSRETATPTASPTSEVIITPTAPQATRRPATAQPTKVPPTRVPPTRVPPPRKQPTAKPVVVMPELRGYGENQAKDILANLGITSIQVQYQSRSELGDLFDKYPAYAVVSSLPVAGRPIDASTFVILGIRSPNDDRPPFPTNVSIPVNPVPVPAP